MELVSNKYQEIKSVLGLSLSLAKANFKLRNEGSYLGIFWYLLNPLVLFSIILFIRGSAFSNINIKYYPVYLLMGIMGTNFFIQTLSASIKIINSNSVFIKSMKITCESLVISQVIQGIFSHIFEIIVLAILMIFYHIPLFYLFFYPLIFSLIVLNVLGMSFIFSTLGVYIVDFSNVWLALSQTLFFITPIFYKAIPGTFIYSINLFNPLFYFLNISRDIIISHIMPEYWMIFNFVFMSFFVFLIGILFFRRFKIKFAERI